MIKGYVVIDKEVCKGCELCVGACPQECLELAQKINQRGYRYAELKDDDTCTGCVNCALVCPDVAITVYRQEKPKKAV
jgi:2-oxoglutarate ferredoxin oxidoreductase subunit delta